MKESEKYIRAAELVENQTMCGCCGAIEEVGLSTKPFLSLMSPHKSVNPNAFFFGDCRCFTEEHIPARVLALCFMAAIAEDEEKSRSRSRR